MATRTGGISVNGIRQFKGRIQSLHNQIVEEVISEVQTDLTAYLSQLRQRSSKRATQIAELMTGRQNNSDIVDDPLKGTRVQITRKRDSKGMIVSVFFFVTRASNDKTREGVFNILDAGSSRSSSSKSALIPIYKTQARTQPRSLNVGPPIEIVGLIRKKRSSIKPIEPRHIYETVLSEVLQRINGRLVTGGRAGTNRYRINLKDMSFFVIQRGQRTAVNE